MISVRECFMKRLGDEEILQAVFRNLIDKYGMEDKYFITDAEESYMISEEEVKAREEDMDLSVFARIPYSHIGYLFDMKDVIEVDGEYYVDGPVILGMHYGDVFCGLEQEDYCHVNRALGCRRCILQFETGNVEVFKIVKEDIGLCEELSH